MLKRVDVAEFSDRWFKCSNCDHLYRWEHHTVQFTMPKQDDTYRNGYCYNCGEPYYSPDIMDLMTVTDHNKPLSHEEICRLADI